MFFRPNKYDYHSVHYSFLFITRELTTWPTNSCPQKSVLLQIIFCSCVIETTLLCEKWQIGSPSWFDIFSWSNEQWEYEGSKGLGGRMIKQLLNSVSLRFRQMIDLLVNDKSLYFAQPRLIIVNHSLPRNRIVFVEYAMMFVSVSTLSNWYNFDTDLITYWHCLHTYLFSFCFFFVFVILVSFLYVTTWTQTQLVLHFFTIQSIFCLTP